MSEKPDSFFIEGKRGMAKSIELLRNIPCMHCDFIADTPYDLGEHIQNEHGIVFLWSSPSFESEYKKWGNRNG